MKRGRLRMLEEGLASQIAEFKANFSSKDIADVAKSGSSVGDLKTAEQYSRDRDYNLHTLLNIPRPKPFHSQYSVMLEELELCLKPVYTAKNLPILLNQFYLDRLQELIQLKHMMLLRWTRLAMGRPKVTEELSAQYKKQIEYLMLEYNDVLNRSRRLSAACSRSSGTCEGMESGDVIPFIRWLVYHQHITKKATSFISRIQWFPLFYESDLVKSVLRRHEKTVDTDPKSPRNKNERAKRWLSAQLSFIPSSTSLLGVHSRGGGAGDSQLLFPPTMASSMQGGTTTGGGEGGEYLMGDQLEYGSLMIPLHQTDVTKSHLLLQQLMAHYGILGPNSFPSMAEELQFYYQVMRKFQTLFQLQEAEITFYTYDKMPEGEGHAKLSKSKLTFRKPANWVPFISTHPIPDALQLSAYTKMKQLVPDIDPLLDLSSQCTHLHNLQRVMYALKQHSVVVRQPVPFTPLSVTSHHTPHDSLLVWKCIYSGLDSRNPLHSGEDTVEEDDSRGEEDSRDKRDEHDGAGHIKGTGNMDMSLDMTGALKVLVNTRGRKVSAKAKQVSKDAFLGFLLLRHLRIRDLRTKCLNILNFFRSIERTLTIYEEGLSLEHNHEQKTKKSTGLLDHGYLFKTPLDYKVDQSDFMRYMEVENHDDFYSFDSKGSVRVWDEKGVSIMYEISLEDLKSLEEELLHVGSFYLRKLALKESAQRVVVGKDDNEDEETELLTQRNVDRFGILLDLWTCEARYLQAKMKVLNCYMEGYHHTLNPSQHSSLHQAVITVIQARPRYDMEGAYFTEIYGKEVRCLEQTSELLLAIINHQMAEERNYNQLVCPKTCLESPMNTQLEPDHLPFGLPLPLLTKHLVSLTGDRQLQVHSYLLEFSQSLCVLGSLPQAIQWALSEAITLTNVESTKEVVSLHHKLLEVATSEWIVTPEIGTNHSTEVFRQLLCGDSVEHPRIMVDVFTLNGNRQGVGQDGGIYSIKEGGGSAIDNKFRAVKAWIDVLQMISLRQHFVHIVLETEYLTRLYKRQLVPLDCEDCHAHLRCIAFDLNLRFPTDKGLDFFITQAQDEVKGGNPRLDHFTPAKLRLAIHELDDISVGAFSFGSKSDMLKLLSSVNNRGLECVRVALQAEVAHRNALVIACQQNALIIRSSEKFISRGDFSTSRSLAQSSLGSTTPLSTPPPGSHSPLSRRNALVDKKLLVHHDLKVHFISIQQEKAPVRDHMLSQFTKQPATILRNVDELERIKCSLISGFCQSLNMVLSVSSLRIQTIRTYQALTKILEDFPATREAHFIVGEPKGHEIAKVGFGNQYAMDSSGKLMVAEMHRSRPHQLISRDGRVLLNLFYIPHFTEILSLFDELNVKERSDCMAVVLNVACGLLQLMQYFCAYVKLGGALDKPGDVTHEKREFGAFWGGVESIGSQLLQLQTDIGHLNEPCNPEQVAEYLNLRCQLMFYCHDITVRHYLRQSLLFTRNTKDLKILDSVSIPACHQLSNTTYNPFVTGLPRNTHYPCYTKLPRPLNLHSSKASATIPWRAFFFHHGLFPVGLDHASETRSLVYISLGCLGAEGLSLAHGEFTGMTLVQEDILQASNLGLAESPVDINHKPSTEEPQAQLQIPKKQKPVESRPSSGGARLSSLSYHSTATTPDPHHATSLQFPPMEGCALLEKFLVYTSQLEQLKIEWGLKVLNCHSISTLRLARDLDSIFKERVHRHAKKIVAKIHVRDLARKHAEEEVNDLTSEVTLLTEASGDTSAAGGEVMEPQAAVDEFKMKEVQVKCLLDMLEQMMITDTSKYLSKLHHLMLNERERDDATLPLDLWKSNAMNFKELTGLSRAHVVEDFAATLQNQMTVWEKEEEGEGPMCSLPLNHLKDCLHRLSCGVLAREKECYQLYASYYEALLRSQYNQLYQKNRDIEHYKALSETNAQQTRQEALCFMGDHTQNLILEITALRSKIDHMHTTLSQRLECSFRRAIREYTSLVDELFSASYLIKNKFEDYRGDLYGDMTQNLHEVRQSVADSIVKLKEKLGLKDKDPATASSVGSEAGVGEDRVGAPLKSEGIKAIQDDNAELNKKIVRIRAINNWNRHKAGVIHNTELFTLQNKLTMAQLEYLTLKMRSEEEIISLKQQVQTMQKHLGKVERECEITKQTLKEEKQKQSSMNKGAAKTQDTFLSKAEKTYAAKLDHLTMELEEKEKQLRSMEEERERVRKHSTFERTQATKQVHGMKQQLSHERSLKLDAFHQVDNLVQQVNQFEHQTMQCTVPQSSFHWCSPHSHSHSPAPTGSAPPSRGAAGGGGFSPNLAMNSMIKASAGLHAASHSRIGRQRSQQQQQATRSAQLSGNTERIDVGQEIIALKLI